MIELLPGRSADLLSFLLWVFKIAPGRTKYSELLCYLPANWEMPNALAGPITPQNWPFEMLRSLCSYVGRTHAWLSYDHGIPNLVREGTFAEGTKLASTVLLRPCNEAESFGSLAILPQNVFVNFLLVVPVTLAEADWKRRVGAANSIYFMVGDKENDPEIAVGYVIDPLRPCAVEDLHLDEEEFDGETDEECRSV
jgi:hypothetical protein